MKYLIDHKTTYTYFEPVSLCHNIARLVPRDTKWQYCRNVVVRIDPEPDTVNKYEDFFGNSIIYFSIEKEHTQLTVHVRSEIELLDRGLLNRGHGVTEDMTEVRQFVVATPMTAWDEEIGAYARVSFVPGRPVLEAAADLMSRIYTEFEFKPGFTTVASPLKVVMRERKGVCQDFAHLAIACVRSVGIPARYISGYIETISPSGGEKLVGVDASHAWFSVFISGQGWVDFDPTNNILPGVQHITIGWGRDYADIAPLNGIILSSGTHGLDVSVDVKRKV
ncbi:MAG TPA: transglutaminase family protein [Puia sp.]|nr:transglutaminase family protein [Puia sp.]